ncbi:MAG: hypothetical protein V1821_01785 [bacterium]
MTGGKNTSGTKGVLADFLTQLGHGGSEKVADLAAGPLLDALVALVALAQKEPREKVRREVARWAEENQGSVEPVAVLLGSTFAVGGDVPDFIIRMLPPQYRDIVQDVVDTLLRKAPQAVAKRLREELKLPEGEGRKEQERRVYCSDHPSDGGRSVFHLARGCPKLPRDPKQRSELTLGEAREIYAAAKKINKKKPEVELCALCGMSIGEEDDMAVKKKEDEPADWGVAFAALRNGLKTGSEKSALDRWQDKMAGTDQEEVEAWMAFTASRKWTPGAVDGLRREAAAVVEAKINSFKPLTEVEKAQKAADAKAEREKKVAETIAKAIPDSWKHPDGSVKRTSLFNPKGKMPWAEAFKRTLTTLNDADKTALEDWAANLNGPAGPDKKAWAKFTGSRKWLIEDIIALQLEDKAAIRAMAAKFK